MFKITQDHKSRKIEIRLHNIDKITVRGTRQAFYVIGAIGRRTTSQNILKKPRHGRLEKFRGRRRRASVIGESFANKTGAARRTLGFDVRGANELEIGFRANSKTLYTKILEEVKGRPTLEISSRSTAGKAQNIMERELKKAHKEGFK